MYFIGTKIDLKTGMLHVESPRCKEKLLIELKSNLFAVVEEINVHAQRFGNNVIVLYLRSSLEKALNFLIPLPPLVLL